MKRVIRTVLLGVLLISPAISRGAILVDQIPTPFSTTTVSGSRSALSMYDIGFVTLPNVRDFATVYDNFSLSTSETIESISWVGAYEVSQITGLNPRFRVDIYSDVAGAPGASLGQTIIAPGASGETAVAGIPSFFSYNASINPFNASANTPYWVSVVAELDYVVDGWGWAFSSTNGDRMSVQDFEVMVGSPPVPVVQRFSDTMDYAFRLQSVPEPGSCVVLAGFVGALSLTRRRRQLK